MGKMLILVVILMTVILGITSQQMLSTNVSQVTDTIGRLQQVQAKNLAKSGTELAISYLSEDKNWTSNIDNMQMGNGELTIDVVDYYGNFLPSGEPDWNEWCSIAQGLTSNDGTYGHLIRAIGQVNGDSKEIISVVQHTESSIEPPEFFDYALLVEGDLEFRGSANVYAYNSNTNNANVHTNSDLEVKGNGYSVEGFGTYADDLDMKPQHNNFNPNSNPENQSTVRQTGEIELPEFDPEEYEDIATLTYYTDQHWNGNRNFGTKENPEIIYIDGDLHMSGSYTGYAAIIVRNDVHISGNVTIQSEDQNTNNIGLYCGGDMHLSGNPDIHGQIYVENNVTRGGNGNGNGKGKGKGNGGGGPGGTGNVDVYGQMIIHGEARFAGNFKIFYKPANVQLVDNIFECEGVDEGRVEIISYYE